MSEPNSVETTAKADDVVKAVEAMERVLKYGFSPEDRRLLTEMLRALSDIKDGLDVIQYKLGIETGVWRKFQNSDVEWTFGQTPNGKPVEELSEITETLDRGEYGSWVRIGVFEYRWSGPEDDPRRFIHRRLAK